MIILSAPSHRLRCRRSKASADSTSLARRSVWAGESGGSSLLSGTFACAPRCFFGRSPRAALCFATRSCCFALSSFATLGVTVIGSRRLNASGLRLSTGSEYEIVGSRLVEVMPVEPPSPADSLFCFWLQRAGEAEQPPKPSDRTCNRGLRLKSDESSPKRRTAVFFQRRQSASPISRTTSFPTIVYACCPAI